jgi:predicted metal-binding protein
MKTFRAIKIVSRPPTSTQVIAEQGFTVKNVTLLVCKSCYTAVAEMRFMAGVHFCSNIEQVSLLQYQALIATSSN